jgi:eukaryotic-like serine/threonine-protein kinase
MPLDKRRWQVLSPLLDELIDLDAAARATRLAQISASDGGLADELAQLLAQQPAIEQSAFLDGAALPASEPTLAGQQIGNYTLERPLGHGGMGVVWLARRSDGRYEGRAAIKFLSLALFGPHGLDRFAREGTALARLTHPNIARLGDAGVTPLGQPYLVLEYIEGEPIDRWCDDHALDITARIRLFQQVLAAVAHAHGKLILHRDLKPSNILVTAEGQVKLLDFGIAKLLDDGEGTRAMTELTQAAGRAFSPDYAAPEQVQGDEVTTATDVYTLGVLLHVLLTGRHPTSRATQTPVERLRSIIEADPPRPSEIVRALRGDLENILLKALRKSPAERYASVGALADDLQRFLTHEPVSARADSVAYQLGKFVRRHRAGVAAAAGVLIASIVVAAVTTEQMLEARRQRDEAQYQSRRAESVSDFMDLLLLSDGGPDRPALTVSERIDAGVRMLETQYRGDPRFAGRMLLHLSEAMTLSDDIQRVIALQQRAYDLGKQVNDRELMAVARCRAAYSHTLASAMEDARKHMAEAQRLLQQINRPELDTRLECALAQARIESESGNRDAAAALLQSTVETIEAAGYTHSAMYTGILTQLASIQLERNDLPAMLELNRQALDAHKRNGRGDTTEYVTVQQNIAVALSVAGEARESLRLREQINRRAREFEPDGQVPFPYLLNHSTLLLRMVRPEEARVDLESALDRVRRGQNRTMLTRFLLTTGWAYIELGQWSQADAALAEATQLVDGGVNSLRHQLELRHAQLSLARGDLRSARQQIESALQLLGYGTPKPERTLSKALIVAADIALRQGLPADAEKFAGDALALTEAAARGPDSSADVGEALLRLAQARISLHSDQNVRPTLERSVRSLTNGLHADHPLTREARATLAKLPS